MTAFASSLEQILVLALACGIGLLGLRRRSAPIATEQPYLDKSFSCALKGLGILLIVVGHYAQMQLEWGECNRVVLFNAHYSPNIGLVWFFFISGYGLAMSKFRIDDFFSRAVNRLGKVFFPMLLVFGVSLVVYVFMPSVFTAEDMVKFHIPQELVLLQTLDFSRPIYILLGAVRWYWFVWCILIYYLIFYVSEFLNRLIFRNRHFEGGGALTIRVISNILSRREKNSRTFLSALLSTDMVLLPRFYRCLFSGASNMAGACYNSDRPLFFLFRK